MASRERQVTSLPQTGDQRRGRLSALAGGLIDPFQRGAAPQPRPATGFYTDTTVCIGCKACEVACKQWNQLPSDGFNWTGNSYDNTGELSATSWRHVKFVEQLQGEADLSPSRLSLQVLSQSAQEENDDLRSALATRHSPLPENRWLMMSDVCKHCVAAPCQQACPTGALVHNEFENVYIQADICNGCSYCVASCPFGVITRSSFDGHAHKCTLCYDRQKDGLVPACAKACPTQSIHFGPIDELRECARKRVEELRGRGLADAYLYGDVPTDTYSELNSFYLLIDRPSVYGLPEKPYNPWLTMRGDYLRAIGGALPALAVLLTLFFILGH